MTILVCTLNTTPQDNPGNYGSEDTHTSTGHVDTRIQQTLPNSSAGSAAALSITTEYGASPAEHDFITLIQFDMSDLPSGATITSAELQLYQESNQGAGPDGIACHALLRSWTASATWNDYDGSNAWGTAGAQNTTSDRESTAQDTTDYQTFAGWLTWDVTAFVEDVADSTLTNNGLLLEMASPLPESAWSNYTSCDGSDGSRPELWIEYTAAVGGSALPLINAYYS